MRAKRVGPQNNSMPVKREPGESKISFRDRQYAAARKLDEEKPKTRFEISQTDARNQFSRPRQMTKKEKHEAAIRAFKAKRRGPKREKRKRSPNSVDSQHRKTRAEYNRYIASPQWAAKRAEYFKANSRECKACGARRKIHVHHITYERFGNEDLKDLLALCEVCHNEVHKRHRLDGGSLQGISLAFVEESQPTSHRS